MRGALIHAVVYVVVNVLVAAIWVGSGKGTTDDVARAFGSIETARSLGYWPIYLAMAWGSALVVHWTVAVTGIPRRRRKRAARAEKAAARAAGRLASAAAQPGPDDAPTLHDGRQRRWFAVMFTDLVGSTPLTEQLGDEAWAEALRRHRDAVRRRIERHGGTEVGTQGDGFLIRFPSPDAAVACAADLQRTVAQRREQDADVPPVRIGIHAGEVVHDGDDDDLVGRVVNLASRVTQVARPGEILVTEAVADHLLVDLPVTDRGLHQLKGIDRPRHLLSVVWGDPPAVVDLDRSRETDLDAVPE